MTPKTTRVNLNSCVIGVLLNGSSTYRNRRKSRYFGVIAMFKKAFSISATIAIGCTRKRSKISKINGVRDGPAYKQSFKLGPVLFADTSYTTLTLVVFLPLLCGANSEHFRLSPHFQGGLALRFHCGFALV